MTHTKLDRFTQSYVETALWSSMDESDDSGGEPMDANYTVDDIAPECLEAMAKDCESFLSMFGPFVEGREEEAGHDFWLTRNGHGAGFWDGDWDQPYEPPTEDDWHAVKEDYRTVGDYLTAMSKPYGEVNLYVGDDSRIYCQ